MTEFLLVLALFLLSHVLPARAGLRARLVAGLGERGYLSVYSGLSLALMAWLIVAAWRAPYVPLWDPTPWQATTALVLVPLGFVLLFAGTLTPNPLSVSFRLARAGAETEEGDAGGKGAVVALTRHPVLWGLAFWALAHTIANGDLVGVLLFGTLALFAVLGTLIVDRRKRRLMGARAWQAHARGTANLPFLAILTGRARPALDRPLLLGIVFAVLVTAGLLVLPGHLWLFGMDPLGWWVAR